MIIASTISHVMAAQAAIYVLIDKCNMAPDTVLCASKQPVTGVRSRQPSWMAACAAMTNSEAIEATKKPSPGRERAKKCWCSPCALGVSYNRSCRRRCRT